MSDRLERQTREPEREVTPHASRPDIFDFLEDKWKDREEGPRSIELHLAFGPGGGSWREDIIHREEFKKNGPVPKRPEIVELANKFYAAAQHHCDEIGHRQGYVILVFNPVMSAKAYGIHTIKLMPNPGTMAGLGGGHGGDGDSGVITSDATHRDLMMSAQLDHVRESNEHVRFMNDSDRKRTDTLLALYHEMLREERAEKAALKAREIEYVKAIEEVNSKRHEREMEKEKHQMMMSLATGGMGLLGQMIPVFQKSLEKKSATDASAARVAAPDVIVATPESNAINVFVKGLVEEQRFALFGHLDEAKNHVPGILTSAQVNIFAAVGDLKAPRSALQQLLLGAPHQITPEQVGRMSQVVPLASLQALYAVIREGEHAGTPAAIEPEPPPTEASP